MLRKSLLATLTLSVLFGTWAVFAQMPPGPGPSFFYSGAQASVANTVTASPILTIPITAGYATNGIHCRLLAGISTTASTNLNVLAMTAQYGTGTSLTVFSNNLPASLGNAPLLVDFYLQQASTVSPATPSQELQAWTFTTASTPVGARIALTQQASQLLNLLLAVQWQSASNLNAFQLSAANCSLGT